MPSVFTRLAGLIPGYTPRPTPPAVVTETPDQRAGRLLAQTQQQLDRSRRRSAPSVGDGVPSNYHRSGGWFLPYADSATKDTPEIRAAMRLMLRDGYVKAAWEPQIATVASEDWQIQPSEPGSSEAEEQSEFVTRVFGDYLMGGMPALVRAVCAALGSDGYSLAEKVWAIADKGRLEGKVILKAAKTKDTEFLRIHGDEFNTILHVESVRRPEEKFPITDFLYSRYLPVFDEPLGTAAFRPAYGPYWMRDTVRKLRVIHTEKKMAGFLVGTYATDDDKGPLELALKAARSATWAAVPEGTRIEAIQLSTATEPDYKSFDESLRDEIVLAIAFATLQILTSNTVGDQRGSSDVQKTMADLGPWLLMSLVQQVVNEQLIPDLIDFNFPYPAAGGYPKLTFGAVSNSELLELVQVVQGAQAIGLKPSKKYYAKALSIQEADPNDPDDQLNGPSQPPAPPGGGGYGGMGGGGFGQPGPMGFSERKPQPSRRSVETFSWRPYTGPEGGRGWQSDTGEVRYQQAQPDDNDGTGGGTDPTRQDIQPGIDKASRVLGGAMVGGLTGSALAGPLGLAVGTVAGAAIGTDTARNVLGGIRALLNRGEEPEGIARKVTAGDPEAVAAVRTDAAEQVRHAAAQLVQQPPADPAEVRSGWAAASSRMRAGDAAELGGHVEALATAREPDKVDAAFKAMGGFLARLTGGALRLAFNAIKAFGRWAAGSGKPYMIWAGSLATAAAVVAAPPVAMGLGLISPGTMFFGLAGALPAAFVVGRVAGATVKRAGAEPFAEWRPYQGPEGGRGWQSDTGEIRYQDAKPDAAGGLHPNASAPGQPGRDEPHQREDELYLVARKAGAPSPHAWAGDTFGFAGAAARAGGKPWNPALPSGPVGRLYGQANTYRDSGNRTIAPKLRAGQTLAPDEQRQVDAVNELAQESALPVPLVLHRRVGDGFPAVKPGDAFADPAPLFTSWRESFVRNTAVTGAPKTLTILADKGAPGFYFGGDPGEVVLPSNAPLEIVKVDGDEITARYRPAKPTGRPGVKTPELAAVLGVYDRLPAGAKARNFLDAAIGNAGSTGMEDGTNPPAAVDPGKFRRALAYAWREAGEVGLSPTDAAPIEAALKAAGATALHPTGAVVPFDPERMTSAVGISSGAKVRVRWPGWGKLSHIGTPGSDPFTKSVVERMAETFAETADIALAGPDGKRTAELLGTSQAAATKTLTDTAERAIHRLLMLPRADQAAHLFEDDELQRIATALAGSIASADLLGRARVRKRAEIAAQRATTFAEWTRYEGPEGGSGWKNAAGEVRYQVEMPGGEASPQGKSPSPSKPKAKKSKAEVNYASDRPASQALIDECLRNTAGTDDPEVIASLVGAPDDAVVTVDDAHPHKAVVTIEHKDYTAKRFIEVNPKNGKRWITNEEFFIKPGAQGKGLGAEVFAAQVENAVESGFVSIRCHAAKENAKDPSKPLNGYYTWPRFGYDCPLSYASVADEDEPVIDAAKAAFPAANTILDVMSTPEGREWWKTNGTDLFGMRFDLSEGSRSMAVFRAYQASRAASKTSISPRSKTPPLMPRGSGLTAASERHGFAEADDPGPPGNPPRPGLTWKRETQRWVRKAEPHKEALSQRAKDIPAAMKAKVTGYVTRKYVALEARYGPAGAKAVMAASLLMLPVPIPGSSLIPVALAEAVRAAAKGVRAVTRNAEPGSSDDMVQAVIGFLTELYAEAGEPAPVIDPERVRAALDRGEVDDDGTPGSVAMFAELPEDPFHAFDEPIPAVQPTEAVDYFRRLVPALGTDPGRYGPMLSRHAFTLAVATEQTLLDKVRKAIAESLVSGVDATPDVQDILDAAGVSPRNPQYAEMVVRTNQMDALNQGSQAEMQTPEMREAFPGWRMDGIVDERTGDDHRLNIGRYYPSTRLFTEVRGPRVYNCRCSPTPIYRTEWAELVRAGKVERV